MWHKVLKKTVFWPLALCFVVLLSACQEKEWYLQSATVDSYQITAQFPNKPVLLERSYQLLDGEETESLQRVQWYAAEGENSFNLSYILVPSHLDVGAVAEELIRSMTLKRDPRLKSAPTEFVEEYELNLPAIGEQFNISVGLESKHLTATAMVLQEGNLLVQLYTAGADSNNNFNEQSQRFFEQLKIGATID